VGCRSKRYGERRGGEVTAEVVGAVGGRGAELGLMKGEGEEGEKEVEVAAVAARVQDTRGEGQGTGRGGGCVRSKEWWMSIRGLGRG